MMTQSTVLYSADHQLFCVRRIDTVWMAQEHERSDLKFELECHHINGEQSIFLGLMETSRLAISNNCPGLAVSICMGEGVLRDLINDTGVIGYFDGAPYDRSAPVKFRVEIDVIGKVCIPKITVNDESILHPALQLERAGPLTALVGHTLTEESIAFENATVQVIGRRDQAGV